MPTEHHHGVHARRHDPSCGYTAIKHGDHVDYLHDGHLHLQNGGGHVEGACT